MKMLKKSLLALAIIATTALNAQAASSIDIKVIGSIDPGTCTPTVAGGGTIDYDSMSPSTLAATGYTVLEEKQVDFSISCTAPSKVAIKLVNGRRNTAAGANDNASTGFARSPVRLFNITGDDMGVAGLGTASNGARVGGFGMRMLQSNALADGNAADILTATDSTSPAWVKATSANMFRFAAAPGVIASWGETGKTVPVAFTTASGSMALQAYLNQRSALDLRSVIHMDGLVTLELVYLP